MSLMTNWGYTLTSVDSLPSILTVEQFNAFTGNKYAGDPRVASNIQAAEAAVRNYCGWHVTTALACKVSTTFFNYSVTKKPCGFLMQLPAAYVTAVSSVEIDGVAHDKFVFEPNGILRVYGLSWHGLHEYSTIDVVYTAGITEAMAVGIRELIAHRVTHALASSNGVQSETAGGVSITYSANWINNSRATALADDNKEVLAPYVVKGVF